MGKKKNIQISNGKIQIGIAGLEVKRRDQKQTKNDKNKNYLSFIIINR